MPRTFAWVWLIDHAQLGLGDHQLVGPGPLMAQVGTTKKEHEQLVVALCSLVRHGTLLSTATSWSHSVLTPGTIHPLIPREANDWAHVG